MGKDRYSVTLRRERFRPLPKKILQTKDIQVRKGYSARATVWVADRPESNLMPTANLTLSHANDKIRFCFQNTADMIVFIENLREFVGDRCLLVHGAQTKALDEFHAYHLERQLPNLNDTTDYTVLQGVNSRVAGERSPDNQERVDKETGEITPLDTG